jgi:hypothetical protein
MLGIADVRMWILAYFTNKKQQFMSHYMIEMDTVDARWLKFVGPLDARHFNFMRPTLKFHAAMDSPFSLFWSPYTKFWRQGRRDAP